MPDRLAIMDGEPLNRTVGRIDNEFQT